MSESDGFSLWHGKGLWLFTLVWLIAMLAALYGFSRLQMQVFDYDGRLVNSSASMAFDREFTELLNREIGVLESKIVHFYQQDCACQSVGSIHINSVKLLADASKRENVEMRLEPNSPVSKMVPSTPAVAVFDENGKLSYLGPYSSGYYCSVGNGIVEPYIEKRAGPGATIVAQAAGCYCPFP